jgi:N-acylneuraminate cytidylyltransferase
MKPFILGAIFARGGSKGVPRKNIRPLNNKPLIAYAIEAGLSVPLIDKLIVSTDDEEIAAVARDYGGEVPFMRPAELATDDSPEILSWKHAVDFCEKMEKRSIDVLVSIPTTSPLRQADDIERCLQKLLGSDADVVITVSESERNPYFNMVKIDEEGNARLALEGDKNIGHRQGAPKIFDITTVAYAVRVPFLKKAGSLFDGKIGTVTVPKERALDIDTLLDFEMAEFFINREQKSDENI